MTLNQLFSVLKCQKFDVLMLSFYVTSIENIHIDKALFFIFVKNHRNTNPN